MKLFGSIVGSIVALVLFLALIAGIGYVGWQLDWWFAQKNADRQAHVIRHGYSNQTTLREQLSKDISDINTITVQIAQVSGGVGFDAALVPALKAQRFAIVNTFCQQAAQVTGDPLALDQQQFVQANCTAGAVSSNSTYNSN